MPNQNRFEGTREDHFAALERRGRRCDANGRMCVGLAVVEYVLLAADGNSNPLPGSELMRKKACTRHQLMYGHSGNYQVLDQRDLRRPPQSKAS